MLTICLDESRPVVGVEEQPDLPDIKKHYFSVGGFF